MASSGEAIGAESSQTNTSGDDRIRIKVKTLAPATYEIHVSRQVSSLYCKLRWLTSGCSNFTPLISFAECPEPHHNLQTYIWNQVTRFSWFLVLQDTIRAVKEQIAPLSGVPAERQRMIAGGRPLEDQETLSSHGSFAARFSRHLVPKCMQCISILGNAVSCKFAPFSSCNCHFFARNRGWVCSAHGRSASSCAGFSASTRCVECYKPEPYCHWQ